jgi:hypothetical protein
MNLINIHCVGGIGVSGSTTQTFGGESSTGYEEWSADYACLYSKVISKSLNMS